MSRLALLYSDALIILLVSSLSHNAIPPREQISYKRAKKHKHENKNDNKHDKSKNNRQEQKQGEHILRPEEYQQEQEQSARTKTRTAVRAPSLEALTRETSTKLNKKRTILQANAQHR